jgi:hypothetical protein
MLDWSWLLHAGGLFASILIGVGALGAVATVLALALRAVAPGSTPGSVLGLICLAGVALTLGTLGYRRSVSQLEQALPMVNADDRPIIQAAGMSEAGSLMVLALAAAALPAGAAVFLYGSRPGVAGKDPAWQRPVAALIAGVGLASALAILAAGQLFQVQAQYAQSMGTPEEMGSPQALQLQALRLRSWGPIAGAAVVVGLAWGFVARRRD